MEQEISGLKVCRQLLLLQTLIQIRPQVVIFTGLLQRCKQWGYQTVHGTNPVTYDLPIPFEEAPFTVAISTGNSGNHASCGGFTKTTIVLRAGTTAGVWDTVGFFIIGCQLQWGNLWAGYTEVLNWYFPLTTSQVYAVCLTKHTKNISSGHNWEPARIEEWNNSYARIHPDGDLGYSVIAICKAQQQWGINTGGAVRTSTLPIPFTNVFLAVASTSSEWCCPGCSATNTTVTTRAYQSNRPDVAQPNDVNWIIIGCQPQWRNNPGLWAIPFTEFVAGGITMTRTGSQSSGTWYGDSGTISLTGYTASCATNESWVSSISGSAIAVGL